MPRLVCGVLSAQGATLQSDRAKRAPTVSDSNRRSPFQKAASECRCIRAEKACTHCRTIRRGDAQERHSPSIAQVRRGFPNRRLEKNVQSLDAVILAAEVGEHFCEKHTVRRRQIALREFDQSGLHRFVFDCAFGEEPRQEVAVAMVGMTD